MAIRTIGVVGAGTTGQGICLAGAANGIDTVLKEINAESVKRARKSLESTLDREIGRWAITSSEKRATLSRIELTESFDPVLRCDVVVEAVQNTWDIKSQVVRDLDLLLSANRSLITTTPTLSVSALARETKRPEKVVGLNFPRDVIHHAVVEIVRGAQTSDETFQTAQELAEALGKTPIEVLDYPGYVTVRIILTMINEAMFTLMEGVASAEEIDRAMRLGFDFPVGPLQMADRMGLDVVMNHMEHLRMELGSKKHLPCPTLRQLVRAGHLGVKTGRGFFRYDAEGNINSDAEAK